jgi:hypothetical protein
MFPVTLRDKHNLGVCPDRVVRITGLREEVTAVA